MKYEALARPRIGSGGTEDGPKGPSSPRTLRVIGGT